MVDIRHYQVLLISGPEQMTEDQRKVTKFLIKINSRVKITFFTQFDERYNKQCNMIQVLEEWYQTHVHRYNTHSPCRLTQSKVVRYHNKDTSE